MERRDPFGLFKMMLDEYSSRILELTAPRPMNALELSDALGIPIAACYRRIRTLKDAGMLKEEGRAQSVGGKTVSLYRSSVEKAEVVLQDGRLRVLIDVDGEETTDEMLLAEEISMLHWDGLPEAAHKKKDAPDA
jgi:predicted ArsR family transcriptional regulator